ncbi:MAG: hypothetical protein MJ070_02360 [Lachnospiraceae bacterium]|nr:hypothetical protein [Lachnospiraceae bacterium]
MANLDLNNVKQLITAAVKKITENKDTVERFKANPAETVQNVLGVNLSSDILEKVIEGVKAKIGADNAAGILAKIKKLFKK